jgi:hypothetical protein
LSEEDLEQWKDTLERILYTVMQGSRSEPATWASVHIVICRALRNVPHGLFLTSVDGSISSSRQGESYVDDTDAWVIAPEASPSDSTAEPMQKLCDALVAGLGTAGGKLGHGKCSVYQIEHQCNKEGKMVLREGKNDKVLTITSTNTDGATITKEVKQLALSELLRALGARIAPGGSQAAEMKVKKKQAEVFSARMDQAPFNRYEAYGALTSFLAKIGYSLGVASFTQKEMD